MQREVRWNKDTEMWSGVDASVLLQGRQRTVVRINAILKWVRTATVVVIKQK
jgi:hypothetical protein